MTLFSRICRKTKPFWYQHPPFGSWYEWEDWREQMKKDYPVQYFVREFISDCAYSCKRMYRDTKYAIKCFFKPYHSDIRKAVPRQWADISHLIVEVNFAMILSFKKEADESCVDWSATEEHQKFKKWLDSCASWIQEGYPNLKKQMMDAYPPHPLPDYLKGKSYDELYSEVNRIEKLIDGTNTNILKQMIDYREYMWT
jgi:hypothetical protein